MIIDMHIYALTPDIPGKLMGQPLSIEQRNRLTLKNQGLVYDRAHKWRKKCTIPFDDLVQIGFIGLIKAVERYDQARGFKFSTLAGTYIEGEILHYLRDKGTTIRVPSTWREQLAKAAKSGQTDLATSHLAHKVASANCLSLYENQDEPAGATLEPPQTQQIEAAWATIAPRVGNLPIKQRHILLKYLNGALKKDLCAEFHMSLRTLDATIQASINAILQNRPAEMDRKPGDRYMPEQLCLPIGQ